MLSKLGKLWLGTYLLNTTVFLFSLFIHYYCAHTDHWSAGAWFAVCLISTMLKIILTIVGAVGFGEKKFLKAKQHEND